MRHLVYLLLIANLVYFGWNLYCDGRAIETQRELPPSASRLVTLQEMQQQSATVPEGEAGRALDALTMTQPPGAGIPACQTLGPFYLEEQLHKVATRLDELGLEPRQLIAEDRKMNSYWVYLPAMERARVLEIAQQLEARKDREYYIGRDNFISLGTFREISRAEIRLRQVRELGLDAILEPRYVTQYAYWLEFQDRGTATPVLEDVLGANPDQQLLTLACL
ncbi:MAG: hypothetical protein WBQ78_17980 [Gammaproteobacteria bacterium]